MLLYLKELQLEILESLMEIRPEKQLHQIQCQCEYYTSDPFCMEKLKTIIVWPICLPLQLLMGGV